MKKQDVGLGLIGSVLLCQRGTTSIEYALIASLICMAILAGAIAIGGHMGNTFNGVAANLT